MNNFLLLLLTLIGFAATNGSCTYRNQYYFYSMINKFGGFSNIKQLTRVSYSSVGKAYEFQQDPEASENGMAVADFSYDLEYALSGTKSKQSWKIQTHYAFEADFGPVESIDGTIGKSEGSTGFITRYFGKFGALGEPMFSGKLAARKKTLFMSNPLAMIKCVLNGHSQVSGLELGVINVPYKQDGQNLNIKLVIDTITKLPIKAQCLENDPLYGDVLYEVIYKNWNGLFPTQIDHLLDSKLIRTETLTNTKTSNGDTTDLNLSDSDGDWKFDVMEAKYGSLSSQFHWRMFLITFPIDFPVELTDKTVSSPPSSVASSQLTLDKNVYRVAGDWQTHYTYVFKINGKLALFDSPIDNRRSAAVYNKIRQQFSTNNNEQIGWIINSHSHFDHIGGTRGNLAHGGSLVVGYSAKQFYQNIFNRPHTVLPNPLNNNDNDNDNDNISIIAVKDSYTIGTGDDQIVIYQINTWHSQNEDLLVVYKPSTKALYVADIFMPGFSLIYDDVPLINKRKMVYGPRAILALAANKNLDIKNVYSVHGASDVQNDISAVKDLASKPIL